MYQDDNYFKIHIDTLEFIIDKLKRLKNLETGKNKKEVSAIIIKLSQKVYSKTHYINNRIKIIERVKNDPHQQKIIKELNKKYVDKRKYIKLDNLYKKSFDLSYFNTISYSLQHAGYSLIFKSTKQCTFVRFNKKIIIEIDKDELFINNPQPINIIGLYDKKSATYEEALKKYGSIKDLYDETFLTSELREILSLLRWGGGFYQQEKIKENRITLQNKPGKHNKYKYRLTITLLGDIFHVGKSIRKL